MTRWLLIALTAISLNVAARGEVVVRSVSYRNGQESLSGLLSFDHARSERRPAILFAADAAANDGAANQRVSQLAKLGYVVLSADLLGRGGARNEIDRRTLRERSEAALEFLSRQPNVDAKRIAAVGYGIGGKAWLELARTGADLEGVVLIHGDPGEPLGADAKKISAAVLIVAGSDDPRLTGEKLHALENDLTSGGVDWQTLRLGGVGRDFSYPQANRNARSEMTFDADADRRANAAVRSFLADIFAPAPGAPAARPAPPAGIPEKVARVLDHVDRTGDAPQGYEGGRTFGNFERNLPINDGKGRRIRYREWDVNPLRQGVNRGPERLVTGSDGSAYFTVDHYRTFKKIR